MTQEELRKEVKFIAETAKHKNEVEIYSNIMQLINQHVKEVIGEDEEFKLPLFEHYTDREIEILQARQKLKKEQRKRAGV